MNKNMDCKKFKIHKMKDGFDKVSKEHNLFNLPFKGIIVSKSQIGMGKSNLIGNMLIKPDGYRNDFDNIYIVNPSQDMDKKFGMIKEQLDIPSHNIFNFYSNEVVDGIFDLIEEQTHQEIEDKKPISHKLVILDDCSFGGGLKSQKNGSLARLFCNGRHYGISTLITAQKLSDVPTVCRENATFLISGSCSNKQLDLLSDDVNLLTNKKQFTKMFRENTDEPYSFLGIDFCNKPNERYINKDFQPIDTNKYL